MYITTSWQSGYRIIFYKQIFQVLIWSQIFSFFTDFFSAFTYNHRNKECTDHLNNTRFGRIVMFENTQKDKQIQNSIKKKCAHIYFKNSFHFEGDFREGHHLHLIKILHILLHHLHFFYLFNSKLFLGRGNDNPPPFQILDLHLLLYVTALIIYLVTY